jgi:hypothetical protein
MTPKHVSASSITAYKACPQRYRLAYVEGIRPAEDPAPFRLGTAYHLGLEVLRSPAGTVVSKWLPDAAPERRLEDANRLDVAIEAATSVYSVVPMSADSTAWAVEREIVANAIAAYAWLYGDNDEYETVATEQEFELPLVNPETGRPTPNFTRVGKIDRIVRHKPTGALMIGEYKTTSKPIDSGSTYWGRLRLDTQSKFYIVAARDLQARGNPTAGLAPGNPTISGLLHDVFHKPTIKPKMLTMAESKTFVETGEYCGQHFERAIVGGISSPQISVDDAQAEVEPGKKEGTFALRETPGMFGARLLQDMTTRPEYYFARRPIAFTDAELAAFEHQVWALQRNMAEMTNTGHWFQNEANCESTYRCAYCPLCYNNVECYFGTSTPPGFRRLAAAQVETPEEVTE